jgi:drug/metabolite transporter (DMT)-like permease
LNAGFSGLTIKPHPTPWLAYGCLAASMALVGSYVGLSKSLVAAFPVFLLAWLRFGIAAAAMVGWVRRRAAEPPLSPHDRVLLFWESFLGNFLFSICMLFGVAATSAVAAGVTMAAIPAAVALLSWALLGERIGRRVAGGIVCAVAGIAWLAMARSGGGAQADEPLWGYALLLVAVFCEAAYVVIGKRLTAQVSPRRISALINLWGLALVTPFGAWQAWSFDFPAVGAGTWALLVFYALACSACCCRWLPRGSALSSWVKRWHPPRPARWGWHCWVCCWPHGRCTVPPRRVHRRRMAAAPAASRRPE